MKSLGEPARKYLDIQPSTDRMVWDDGEQVINVIFRDGALMNATRQGRDLSEEVIVSPPPTPPMRPRL